MTAELSIKDTDVTHHHHQQQQQQQHQSSHRALEASKSFNSTPSPTPSASNGVGRPLARQDHVRGSADSLVTKASSHY